MKNSSPSKKTNLLSGKKAYSHSQSFGKGNPMPDFSDVWVGGNDFERRHIGPTPAEKTAMLNHLDYQDIDQLIDATVPAQIRCKTPFKTEPAQTEVEATKRLKKMASKNRVMRSYLGMGYNDTLVPAVIQRNILENPGWYTQYTPYQAEISQGRLEALLNFQTLVSDLTGLEVANASLLDEATAAAEAMNMSFNSKKRDSSNIFIVSDRCHPQTIDVVNTRAEPLGIEVKVTNIENENFADKPFGILLQYPASCGKIEDYSTIIEKAHSVNALVTVAADIMSLALLKSPGELGADIAVGSTQRFGVPLGYGGPHAAFFATKDAFKRKIPGRIIGVSKDTEGRLAYRMALQTREQHIRRDKATSNICTSQVLLAIMASMYAVYHGPDGIRKIALKIHGMTCILAGMLKELGYELPNNYFDTLKIEVSKSDQEKVMTAALIKGINLRKFDDGHICVALDETVNFKDIDDLAECFANGQSVPSAKDKSSEVTSAIDSSMARESEFLEHPVFNSHHSESKMMRYIKQLEARDLSLTKSMIPLGSCTMKLNAASELYPISWPEFNSIHPFAPADQALGYKELFDALEFQLASCTGFDAVSLQPNSGAQGEFAGLLVIRELHKANNQGHRNICLIPKSAHGTNPASAVLTGMKVVVTKCDENGNMDVEDLKAKAELHKDNLAALMVTYPSTHGVFEESISEICQIIHDNGGQVYMDGANMNAQIGLCKPGEFGPDVCHLNLHKTYAIPHGGGGPGMGPIAVKKHLAPFLPKHSQQKCGGAEGASAVSAAPWGSASILPISLMYCWMLGDSGLTNATKTAILNANYIAKKLDPHYPVLYKGAKGLVAHECIVDVRQIKAAVGIDVEDVAKRLMDYGFHAPTVSFPVPGTLMIEPTESESKEEIDRFCDAMINIRAEIKEIEEGRGDKNNNLLKNAPHTASSIVLEWDKPYSKETAVFPTSWVKANKFWPSVARIDSAYGDRNLICSCPSIEEYQ
jgi:glycine dehydrogenase